MNVNDVKAIFPNNGYRVTKTSSGVEVILEKCPLDGNHESYKTYVNPEKELLKCYVCHKPGEGLKLKDFDTELRRLARRRSKEGVKEVFKQILPPLPATIRLNELGLDHPCSLYLANRGIPAENALKADIRWKPQGIPAWVKEYDNGKKAPFGIHPGLIIPVRVHKKLMGFQFAPVPRVPKTPKYVTAPSSCLAGSVFNFDNVSKGDLCVITEGVFDALKLPNISIALLTDNIGKRKLKLLSSVGFKRFILMLDGDRTESHLNKEYAKLLSICNDVKIVRLPSDKDPGDCTYNELMGFIDGVL